MSHKHAKFIHAWADGDEVQYLLGHEWLSIGSSHVWGLENKYRFAPKMLKCGDMEFQEPMRVAPEEGTKYWTAEIHANHCGVVQVDEWTWVNDKQDKECLKAGICHLTSEAAEAHARALIALTEVKE